MNVIIPPSTFVMPTLWDNFLKTLEARRRWVSVSWWMMKFLVVFVAAQADWIFGRILMADSQSGA
jgi:hypothetical protein